jgi:hypothetical protein
MGALKAGTKQVESITVETKTHIASEMRYGVCELPLFPSAPLHLELRSRTWTLLEPTIINDFCARKSKNFRPGMFFPNPLRVQ